MNKIVLNKNLCLIITIIVSVFVIGIICFAGWKYFSEAVILKHETGKDININKNYSYQMQPDIYKDKIIWVDLRHNTNKECKKGNLAHQPCTSEIYLFDISTGKTKRVTNSNLWKSDPQLNNDYIIWHERKNQIKYENEKEMAMNLKTGQCFELDSGNYRLRNWGWKLISDNKILYIKSGAEGESGIYIMDLNTQENTKLVEQKIGNYTNISNINASEEYLIWLEEFWENGRVVKKIHALNFETKQEIILGEFKPQYYNLAIYKNKVVWEKSTLDNQDFDIYLFDLITEKTEKIISKENSQVTPYIYENYLTYVDLADDSYKIYNFNNQKTQTIKPVHSFAPSEGLKINNNRIVWTDGGDIHFLDLGISKN